MPAPIEVTSESEPEQVRAGSTKKTYASKKRRGTSASQSDVQEVEKEAIEGPEDTAAEDGDDDEEGGEEEYEIEKILDSKKGHFYAGRTGYFVKWKNYEEEHNSWVDEKDAGNAQQLIDDYWARKKKSGPRKSEPTKPKAKVVEKIGRKSLADVESSAEPETLAKKRGRAKKQDLSSDRVDAGDEDEDEERAKKKPRKSNGLDRKNKQQAENEEVTVGNMKKHLKVLSWEDLIESVDTVERSDDGELYVFFTLKNDKKRVRENSRLCAEKFPQKLIMFYESNLRWKLEELDVPVEAEQ